VVVAHGLRWSNARDEGGAAVSFGTIFSGEVEMVTCHRCIGGLRQPLLPMGIHARSGLVGPDLDYARAVMAYGSRGELLLVGNVDGRHSQLRAVIYRVCHLSQLVG
jgi:hypothetical protein